MSVVTIWQTGSLLTLFLIATGAIASTTEQGPGGTIEFIDSNGGVGGQTDGGDDNGGGMGAGSGSGGGGGGRNYGNCKEPCEVWVETGSRPDQGYCKKLYDPAKQGCCDKGDGTYEITNKPEDKDPCASKDVQGKGGSCQPQYGLGTYGCNYGVTVCYNGSKSPCSCNCKGIQNPGLVDCIKAHEEGHVGDENQQCDKCKTGTAKPKDKGKHDKWHCEQWKKDIECAKSIPGGEDDDQVQKFIKDMDDNIKHPWNGC